MNGWWPNQYRGITQLPQMEAPGKAVAYTSPTGTGKSLVMAEMLTSCESAILYTNRRMLLDQISRYLDENGVSHGVMMAGRPTDFTKSVQLASVQSVVSRCLKKNKWRLPEVKRVIFDEAHVNKEQSAIELLDRHYEQGASAFGFTATPLNIGHIYDDILVAGNMSEGRACGALVPARHIAPDEVDMKRLKRQNNGEYSTKQVVNAMLTHCIIGRVIDNWRRLNPDERPTILFAPAVPESRWFAEQFVKHGINAAHVDGQTVWIDGKLYESDREARDEVRDRLREGDIKIVCNRFVLREGIDWPFVEHGILATIFGALTSYLQSCGRLLRASPSTGKECATIQDHGGNWHLHGSVNADRRWENALRLTDYVVGESRIQMMRKNEIPEPIRCPKCHAIRSSGKICPTCGHYHKQSVRHVVQHGGMLKERKGDVYKPPRTDKRNDVAERWKKIYFRCRKKGMTFNQARGLYQYENNWSAPPDGLPFMPMKTLDWFEKIEDIPYNRLHSDPNWTPDSQMSFA